MKVEILQLIDGAKRAKGTAVIIDVFRAFSLEAYMFGKGAGTIIPVGNKDLAYELKKEFPDIILAGERGGKVLPGFDLPNSPSELEKIDVRGKTIVHTTSAGTQGIANASRAEVIFAGSFVNAKATAECILRSGADDVSLVCMGLAGAEETEEDTLCAEYIRGLLLGYEVPLLEEMEKLRYSSGAKFFDPSQNDIFPETDFYMCTKVDIFNFAIKLTQGENNLPHMEKIPVLEYGVIG